MHELDACGKYVLAGVAALAALASLGTAHARFTVLYAFTGGTDGDAPSAVIKDSAGNLYGTTINIAARMEEAAKAHNLACAISGDVVEALHRDDGRLLPIGHEKIRGIDNEIPIFEYRLASETWCSID